MPLPRIFDETGTGTEVRDELRAHRLMHYQRFVGGNRDLNKRPKEPQMLCKQSLSIKIGILERKIIIMAEMSCHNIRSAVAVLAKFRVCNPSSTCVRRFKTRRHLLTYR